MAEQNYFVVSTSNNDIINVIYADSDAVANGSLRYFGSGGVEITDVLFVEERDDIYAELGREGHDFQYFGGSYDVFQPKEPEDDTWTKNSDGVWNEIINRPSLNHFWSVANTAWVEAREDIQKIL